MNEKIEPQEINETGLDDELGDEVLDRPAGSLQLSCLCGNP